MGTTHAWTGDGVVATGGNAGDVGAVYSSVPISSATLRFEISAYW